MNEYLCRRTLGRWLMAALAAAAAACSGPSGPSDVPTSTATPTTTVSGYLASGAVTDEAGAPIAGAVVEVVYAVQAEPQLSIKWITTTTNAGGQYDVTLPIMRPFKKWPYERETSGLVHAFAEGFENNSQWWELGTVHRVMNIPMRRTRTVAAGAPITVMIEPHSSICFDDEDWWVPSHRCESFTVVPDQAGTLTITAEPSAAGSAVPLVFSATSGQYNGQVLGAGTVSLRQVHAGESYHIFAGIPEGTSRQITLSTTLQP